MVSKKCKQQVKSAIRQEIREHGDPKLAKRLVREHIQYKANAKQKGILKGSGGLLSNKTGLLSNKY